MMGPAATITGNKWDSSEPDNPIDRVEVMHTRPPGVLPAAAYPTLSAFEHLGAEGIL